ncbi:MAG: response regulator [Deltaproteobacteria bacterium]|nr:response regulator [Deltaproteobacteria bacterium]
MNENIRVLIADRNANIRSLLKRELEAEGYQVELVKDGQELMKRVSREDCPHLLIIDPNLPLIHGEAILTMLTNRLPPLAVILHTNLTELVNHPFAMEAWVFIEKGENLDKLKTAIAETVRKRPPQADKREAFPG